VELTACVSDREEEGAVARTRWVRENSRMLPASLRLVVGLVLAGAACGGDAGRDTAATPADTLRVPAPAEASLGDDPLSRSVRRGLALVSDTRDSLPAHVGAQLRCVSCHLEAGRRAFAMPWVGAYGRFPQFRSRSGAVIRLEERINDCIRRSLNGTALPTDGDDMRDMVAYVSWLSRGVPSGTRLHGTGIDSLVPLAGDTARGRAVYAQYCARCHAPDGGGLLGRGIANAGAPLWGMGSFNIGSGMARVRVMAAFVHRQMPFDRPGTLTPQQAFDVAAFIAAQPRPDYAGKASDWPRGDPPPDVAYPTRAAPRPSRP
jgi:thiosulfate dehydrogenase